MPPERTPPTPESSRTPEAGDHFARVPEWLLEAEVSHAAIRLYAFLDRRAGEDNTTFPSRTTLAAQMRCSRSTIDRLLYELANAAHPTAMDPKRPDRPLMAVRIDRRRDDAGDWTSNLYTVAARTLLRSRTDAATPPHEHSHGGRTDAATGSRMDDAQNQSPGEPEPPGAEAAPPTSPLDLARQLVSRATDELPEQLEKLDRAHGQRVTNAALQRLVDRGARYKYPSDLVHAIKAIAANVIEAQYEDKKAETQRRLADHRTDIDPSQAERARQLKAELAARRAS